MTEETKKDNGVVDKPTNITRDEVRNSGEEKILGGENGGVTSEPFSLSFSSDRFAFSESPEEEDAAVECINNSKHLFTEFKRPPSLEEALEAMGYSEEKAKGLSEMFLERARGKLEEFDAPGLTAEDIAVLFCYTYEWDEKKFGESFDSPYRKLNKSLSVDRSNASLKKTRGFLFLLLAALRKLPH